MTKPCSDILNEAADLIEKFGWIQGNYGAEECGYCALGAILAVDFDDDYSIHSFNNYIQDNHPDMNLGAVEWNDTPGRTKEEVISTLRKAAAYVSVPQGS